MIKKSLQNCEFVCGYSVYIFLRQVKKQPAFLWHIIIWLRTSVKQRGEKDTRSRLIMRTFFLFFIIDRNWKCRVFQRRFSSDTRIFLLYHFPKQFFIVLESLSLFRCCRFSFFFFLVLFIVLAVILLLLLLCLLFVVVEIFVSIVIIIISDFFLLERRNFRSLYRYKISKWTKRYLCFFLNP